MAVFAPLYYLFGHRVAWLAETPITLALVTMAGLLAYRHRENIGRLIAGKESKLGAKKTG
jgi:glycerol-3-phosphate acyltransferase PlsY